VRTALATRKARTHTHLIPRNRSPPAWGGANKYKSHAHRPHTRRRTTHTCQRDERGTPQRHSGRTTQATGDRGCWFCRRVDSLCKSLLVCVCVACRGRARRCNLCASLCWCVCVCGRRGRARRCNLSVLSSCRGLSLPVPSQLECRQQAPLRAGVRFPVDSKMSYTDACAGRHPALGSNPTTSGGVRHSEGRDCRFWDQRMSGHAVGESAE
jgi:hypothetical protein